MENSSDMIWLAPDTGGGSAVSYVRWPLVNTWGLFCALRYRLVFEFAYFSQEVHK